jgi:hypothetical protein
MDRQAGVGGAAGSGSVDVSALSRNGSARLAQEAEGAGALILFDLTTPAVCRCWPRSGAPRLADWAP